MVKLNVKIKICILFIIMESLSVMFYIFVLFKCYEEVDKCKTSCISYNKLPIYFPTNEYIIKNCNGDIDNVRIDCINYSKIYCNNKAKSCYCSIRGDTTTRFPPDEYECDLGGNIHGFKCVSDVDVLRLMIIF